MITQTAIDRILSLLRLQNPLIAVYDSAPGPEFGPQTVARGRACCFAFYQRWMKGETLVIQKDSGSFSAPEYGCPGMQRAFGLEKEYPPYMAHFLTDGVGSPRGGEGLMASAELAQEFIDAADAPALTGDTVLLGPLRPELWERVRSVTFFVDPDRLAGVMTLANYFTGIAAPVMAPFSSGCGLMLRELENLEVDCALIGCTDLAMRKYLPPEILALTVSPSRFERMLAVPDDSFLHRDWWSALMQARGL